MLEHCGSWSRGAACPPPSESQPGLSPTGEEHPLGPASTLAPGQEQEVFGLTQYLFSHLPILTMALADRLAMVMVPPFYGSD